MSAAKALLALYQEPELDLAAAAADSKRIPACTKAKHIIREVTFGYYLFKFFEFVTL